MKIAKLILVAVVLTQPANAKKISPVLRNNQGDFDPWNKNRWSVWYKNDKIVETFEIDTSVRFADRASDSSPDLSQPTSGVLFLVSENQGIKINGNNLLVDVDNKLAKKPFSQCFFFSQPLDKTKAPTEIRNFIW